MHLQYCKRILNLRSSTPNFVVFGEIGRFPVEIIITLLLQIFVLFVFTVSFQIIQYSSKADSTVVPLEGLLSIQIKLQCHLHKVL
jgi:hypothetical protein